MNRIIKIVAAAAIVSLMGSCNLYRKYQLPTDSSDLAAEYAKGRYEGIDTASFGTTPWQEVFTDPVLADLIHQALDNNLNLKNSKANIDIAAAQLRGAKLAFFPSVAFAPNGAGASYKGSDLSWGYQLPVAVSWEVDVFGKLLNSKRGAEASWLQSQNYAQAVTSQLIASVANCYYTLSSLEDQLQLARATAQNWKESVEVMKNFKLAGRVNEAAVVQSTAQYYSILAQITDIETSIVKTNNTMSLLLGVLPQKWNVPAGASVEIPGTLDGSIAITQLANRPDVRAAEQAVAVAYYATNQARANFYPGLNISVNGGFTNQLGTIISNPGAWFVQLAGSLTAPIFARGANKARLEAAKLQQQQAMNNFEQAILSASADVSNAMTVYAKCSEKQGLIAEQTANLEKSVEYTGELLKFGTSTYLEVLTAQQNLLSSQMAAITCRLSRSQAVINLYQSLGGR